jgi:negative regulator of replication initiation
MSVGLTGSVSTTDVYASYVAQDTTAKTSAATTEEAESTTASESEGVVYEKSTGDEKKASYSINKMSAEDRAALVSQLKADQEQRQTQLLDIVRQMMTKQATTYTTATSDSSDDIWKFLAKGDFTVDAATKAQAQQDISEDGYWGVTQTAQRLFDFASALAGDDEDQMKKMQEAMQKGYEQATKSWGRDLPDISSKTLEAANKLFEDYYNSKKTVEE